MELIDQIESIYKSDTGSTFSFLDSFEIVKTEISTLMLLYDHCNRNSEEAISLFVERYLNRGEILVHIQPALREFYSYFMTVVLPVDNHPFIDIGATIYVNAAFASPEHNKIPPAPLLKCKNQGSVFIDLASGFNFTDYFDSLETGTHYCVVDRSKFTCKCISIAKEIKRVNNLTIINEDIHSVNRNHFPSNVEIIRAQNIFYYIPDFYDAVPKFKEMIEFGGVFLFQEYSQKRSFFSSSPPYSIIDEYFLDGWSRNYEYNLTPISKSFDSLIFTKSGFQKRP